MNLNFIISFFQKPFPKIPFTLKTIFANFLVGVFIATFLLVFEPFEINLWQTEYKSIKIIGYGVVSFIIPTILNLLFELLPEKIKENWVIGYEILALIIVILSIAFGNLVYSQFIEGAAYNFSSYLKAILITISIGIFPILFHVIYKHQLFLRKNLQEAQSINESILSSNENLKRENDVSNSIKVEIFSESEEKSQINNLLESNELNSKIELIAENNKDILELELSDFLYMESIDNYVQVYYMNHDKLSKMVLRGSLKRFEDQIKNQEILRCHRSFIINCSNVQKIEGNAAGYKLRLKGVDQMIPISRSLSKEVLEKIKSIHPNYLSV